MEVFKMRFWNGQAMQSRFNWEEHDLGCSLKAYRESLKYYKNTTKDARKSIEKELKRSK